ncbi:universal stress protein [Myxacorys almedinensis]|uniref:Universal stress protein n=1 Tax=Myxacorys almedinensis A TaxID=2690445 RepID=A0A8J8CLI0_9CYAN|nr:universal stress protein [Myxacorys almedinensis]NDJ16112.1 universal stress protein [Myxacorys almedinensis A]
MFQKLLVAIDRSSESRSVFEAALAMAKASHASLMVLHVLSPFDETYPTDPYIGVPTIATQVYLDRWKEQEQIGIEILRSLQTEATYAGVPTEFTQNLGEPGRTICALAKTWNADLILIGRRGLNGLSELFLGSVSNYVVHHAPCSVLIVQKQPHAHPTEQPATATISV